MFKQTDLTYLEKQITELKTEIERVNYNYVMNSMHSHLTGYNYDPEEDELQIKRGIKLLYNSICIYFEVIGLTDYLKNFKDIFKDKINNSKELLISEKLFPHEDAEFELVILDEFASFLYPFQFFGYKEEKEKDFKRLISILENTFFIVEKTDTIITNETSIYTPVKWVLELYFPSIRKAKGGFNQKFKIYKPDIQIPELGTSIEYKYVRKGSNVDEYIDQIKIDATNYISEKTGERFVAVICLQDKISGTKESILHSWESKNFPTNWTPIILFQ
ncbi:hypothetical protein [Spirosoma oryzicola]|uniref:PD-(D/E)XK nuclease domain-containing protein n=1 Tax=Spirosoma oryzicola TaxID=2898794 RepID=UPI001E4193C2|nr:hypothetical protein [Spirosoma oryzicola]UHG92550.1 hypothetical protein LQ777_06490 [Spirosoma oryzicola]